MSVWFVTPAWQRYELTAICLEQRRRVIDILRAHDVDANCVVIADDENLDIARGLSFATVERDNLWLGRRFNDGMEYAGRRGATWIVPIGSDSWIDPAYFLPLPLASRTSANYVAVEAERMAILRVGAKNPAGPHMLHRSTFPVTFRPARDEISRRVDSSTLHGLHGLRWEWRDIHPLQYVGFRGTPHLTPYELLWRTWGVVESEDPWTELAACYPMDLVERAHRYLSSTSAPEPIPAATASAPSEPSTA